MDLKSPLSGSKWLSNSPLLLLLLLMQSCYVPVSFDSETTKALPCIYCILNPEDSVQQVDFYFVSPLGHNIHNGINDARVILEASVSHGVENHSVVAEFKPMGDGLWQIPTTNLDSIFFKSNTRLRLQAVLPSGDTVSSEISALPDYSLETVYVEETKMQFIIGSAPAIWVFGIYDMSGTGFWNIIDEISFDREDLADAFNKNGDWHYRYVRILNHRTETAPELQNLASNTVFVSRDTVTVSINSNAPSHFVVEMVSDEYDYYLRDMAEKELLSQVGGDISFIYSSTSTYTNIVGGTGIFGFKRMKEF